MTQAQAVITALLRILGALPLLLLIGLLLIPPKLEFAPDELTRLPADSDVHMRTIDFAETTTVYVTSLGYVALLFFILLIVFSKKIAVWITPKTEEP